MEASSIKLVYFSPTGTTRKILESVAQGFGNEKMEHVNMTLPDAATRALDSFSDELAVIGAPVYAGRLPDIAVNRFKRFRAQNTPAVLIVVYGNRAYEDALLELSNISKELGFIPVACGAFIGEHSFATETVSIANGRPDVRDLEKAAQFGAAVRKKLKNINGLSDIPTLNVPGNFPFKDGMPSFPESPRTENDVCTTCGTCAEVCPPGAISVSDTVQTDPDVCINCCACVKNCPTGARIMDAPMIMEVAKWLSENYHQRKEPETFI